MSILPFQLVIPGQAIQIETDVEVGPPGYSPGGSITLTSSRAIWDTGAHRTCLTTVLATSLGLAPTSTEEVMGVTGSQTALVCPASLVLPNGLIIKTLEALVLDRPDFGAPGIDVIIGMDLIGLGKFSLSFDGANTLFEFSFSEPVAKAMGIWSRPVARNRGERRRQQRNSK